MSTDETATSDKWRWIDVSVVFVIHYRKFAEHGGLGRIRDPGNESSEHSDLCEFRQ